MSYPTYKDFDKCASGILKDDYDYKYSLKVKSAAPKGVTITTTSDYTPEGAVTGKMSAKWASESGFAVDKLEVDKKGKISTETSLSGVAPGLKFEFKGNDSDQGNLGLVYKHQHATCTAELDVLKFSSLKASVHGGLNDFTAGVSSVLKLGDKMDVSVLDVCASYTLPNQIFAGVSTTNKFTDFGLSLKYMGCPKYVFAGRVDQKAKGDLTAELAGVYKCCPSTTLKAKVNTDAIVSFSVKKECDKKASIVGALEANAKDLSQFKVGLTATLG